MTIEEDRKTQLIKCIPSVFTFKKVLYIGANEKRFHFQADLKDNNCVADVLEIDRERCNGLKKFAWLNQVICGSVTNAEKLFFPNQYDLILWSHGPEILDKELIVPTIQKLEIIAPKLLVMMAPWGKYTHTNVARIDFNASALYEEDFEKLGYATSTIGEKDKNGSNLLAWKLLKKN